MHAGESALISLMAPLSGPGHELRPAPPSTGFEPPRKRDTNLSDHDAAVAEACRPVYEELRARRVRP